MTRAEMEARRKRENSLKKKIKAYCGLDKYYDIYFISETEVSVQGTMGGDLIEYRLTLDKKGNIVSCGEK